MNPLLTGYTPGRVAALPAVPSAGGAARLTVVVLAPQPAAAP